MSGGDCDGFQAVRHIKDIDRRLTSLSYGVSDRIDRASRYKVEDFLDKATFMCLWGIGCEVAGSIPGSVGQSITSSHTARCTTIT